MRVQINDEMLNGRCVQTIRQLSILHYLYDHHGATIDRLSRKFGVSTKTIRRDMNALLTVGYSLYDERDDYGNNIWKLMTGQMIPVLPKKARSTVTFAADTQHPRGASIARSHA